MSERCSGCVDLEAMLQHAGGQLCPQQGAACRLLTESGKNLFCSRVVTDAVSSTPKRHLFLFLEDDFSLFSGVVWSSAGLAAKLRLLTGQLQLDHPVSSWESFIRVRFISAHHTPTGGSAKPHCTSSTPPERQTCDVFQPMDQSSLKNSDVLILTGLTQMPTANPDGMLGEFCSNLGQLRKGWMLTCVMLSGRDLMLQFVVLSAAMTIRAGGNVLVPCYSSGVIYDLLECLYQFIESANLGTTPFYFISPVANSSLEFSQIFAEWSVAFISSSLGHVATFGFISSSFLSIHCIFVCFFLKHSSIQW